MVVINDGRGWNPSFFNLFLYEQCSLFVPNCICKNNGLPPCSNYIILLSQ